MLITPAPKPLIVVPIRRWFWWSVGSQLLLCNPVCVVLFAAASWSFFAERIPHEEEQLLRFFGREYVDYARASVIGIPFVESPGARAAAAAASTAAALSALSEASARRQPHHVAGQGGAARQN